MSENDTKLLELLTSTPFEVALLNTQKNLAFRIANTFLLTEAYQHILKVLHDNDEELSQTPSIGFSGTLLRFFIKVEDPKASKFLEKISEFLKPNRIIRSPEEENLGKFNPEGILKILNNSQISTATKAVELTKELYNLGVISSIEKRIDPKAVEDYYKELKFLKDALDEYSKKLKNHINDKSTSQNDKLILIKYYQRLENSRATGEEFYFANPIIEGSNIDKFNDLNEFAGTINSAFRVKDSPIVAYQNEISSRSSTARNLINKTLKFFGVASQDSGSKTTDSIFAKLTRKNSALETLIDITRARTIIDQTFEIKKILDFAEFLSSSENKQNNLPSAKIEEDEKHGKVKINITSTGYLNFRIVYKGLGQFEGKDLFSEHQIVGENQNKANTYSHKIYDNLKELFDDKKLLREDLTQGELFEALRRQSEIYNEFNNCGAGSFLFQLKSCLSSHDLSDDIKNYFKSPNEIKIKNILWGRNHNSNDYNQPLNDKQKELLKKEFVRSHYAHQLISGGAELLESTHPSMKALYVLLAENHNKISEKANNDIDLEEKKLILINSELISKIRTQVEKKSEEHEFDYFAKDKNIVKKINRGVHLE